MSTEDRIIRAPDFDTDSGDAPVIFLAGPIQGAENWQERAATIIVAANPDVIVASPRRLELVEGGLSGQGYADQVDWETTYLRRAGEKGCVLFWLAAQDHVVPGRQYAQTTRFELGEWKERAMRRETNMSLGIEDSFSNKRYITRRFGQDCPHVPVFHTLEDVCAQAVVLATSL